MEIKTYSRKQLAEFYGVSNRHFDEMVKPLRLLMTNQDTRKNIYYPNEVKLIIEKYGEPSTNVVRR